MRILFANDYATDSGGAEAVTRILLQGLRQRGHEAKLFASTAGRKIPAVDVDYPCYGTTAPWRTLLQTANPLAASSFHRAVEDFQPDVVHVRMFLTQLSPLILPVLRSVKSLYHAVWYRTVCPVGTNLLPNGATCEDLAGKACKANGCLPLRDWYPLMFQRRLQARWFNAFDAVVANSEATRLALSTGGIDSDYVVPNGVPPRKARPPLSDPPIVLFAGRLVREKGVHVLLDAFAAVVDKVPQARLVIAGEGPELTALEQKVAELSLVQSVDFIGHLAPEELDQVRARTWVQAVPSIWAEPFGIVAAESMMTGTAVVASNSGGLRDIVRSGETGLLVEPGDSSTMGAALTQLLSNRDTAERMGANGRRIALSEYSDTILVDRFLEIYRSLSCTAEEK